MPAEDIIASRDPVEELKDLRTLWEKYRLLTHELLKFIDAEQVEEFLELSRQREQLFNSIRESSAEEEFHRSAEFAELAEELKPLDMKLIYKARAWLNKSQRQNSAVKSYDLTAVSSVGNLLNRKY